VNSQQDLGVRVVGELRKEGGKVVDDRVRGGGDVVGWVAAGEKAELTL